MPNNPTGASDNDINAATQTGSVRTIKSSDALGVASSDAEQSFEKLQTFSGGISVAGATFSGNISAPNIVNSINGATGAVTVTSSSMDFVLFNLGII